MRRFSLYLALLLASLGPVCARAQVQAAAALTYVWTSTSTAALGQQGQYLVLNGTSAPRPGNYTIDWNVTGTAPSVCTFNAQGSSDGVVWYWVDTASPVSCTTSSQTYVTYKPVLYLRINLVTFTAGDATTTIKFHYTGGRS